MTWCVMVGGYDIRGDVIMCCYVRGGMTSVDDGYGVSDGGDDVNE